MRHSLIALLSLGLVIPLGAETVDPTESQQATETAAEQARRESLRGWSEGRERDLALRIEARNRFRTADREARRQVLLPWYRQYLASVGPLKEALDAYQVALVDPADLTRSCQSLHDTSQALSTGTLLVDAPKESSGFADALAAIEAAAADCAAGERSSEDCHMNDAKEALAAFARALHVHGLTP